MTEKIIRKSEEKGKKFNWELYTEIYPDLSKFKSEDEAKTHWLRHGQYENRVSSFTLLIKSFQFKISDFPEEL